MGLGEGVESDQVFRDRSFPWCGNAEKRGTIDEIRSAVEQHAGDGFIEFNDLVGDRFVGMDCNLVYVFWLLIVVCESGFAGRHRDWMQEGNSGRGATEICPFR